MTQENAANHTSRDFEDCAITPLHVHGTTDLEAVPLPPGLFKSVDHWKPLPAVPLRSRKRRWRQFWSRVPGRLDAVEEEQVADPTDRLPCERQHEKSSTDRLSKDGEHVQGPKTD